MFLGAPARFQVFLLKNCFSVFVLNSVEDKDSRFISGFKFKEKSFRVSRGQRYADECRRIYVVAKK